MPPSRAHNAVGGDSTRSPTRETYATRIRKREREEDESSYGIESSSKARVNTPRSSKRRKNQLDAASGGHAVVDLTGDEPGPSTPIKKRKQSKKSPESAKSPGERRSRKFRDHPPQTFLLKLERARTQRMFVVGRTRSGTDNAPEERVEIVGTTGNIYTIVIGKEPSCSCPDAKKGNQCKHIVYVLCNVLKAPEHLQYQLAFLSSELNDILSHAPPNPKDSTSAEEEDGKRKKVEGDCPICFMEFEPETEEIVWCRAACGNNIHKTCFEQWAASSRKSGDQVKCVYCRSRWEQDHGPMTEVLKSGWVNEEGYYNVGEELGLPEERGRATIPLY
ncbi:hypothetical protein FQN54_007279 [Arachnomyces sp. PD_36]|nr:hypothetical protein FQN54_007279 [Arachnomyces sp. PD_36]